MNLHAMAVLDKRRADVEGSPGPVRFDDAHLAYCTNIHPAESWEETERVLRSDVLAVRDELRGTGHLGADDAFAIGLRLSARAARELLEGDRVARFRGWLEETNTYVFTINGFPYGDFHGTRVKEKVFQPDWTDPQRVEYTMDLFRILAQVAKPGTGVSVSTLPGSHKSFDADEPVMLRQLAEIAIWIDDLADKSGHDLHLGLEPEPLGHFENTRETLSFFERLHQSAPDPDAIRRRIGVNHDTCHFAIEFDPAGSSLDALAAAGIRISKIHLSNALALDPRDPASIEAIRAFDEPTYFHQVIARHESGDLRRYPDLPDFLAAERSGLVEARVHFHIPLDAAPAPPLRSTRTEVEAVLAWKQANAAGCPHYEIETYTWGVLPRDMQRPLTAQIAGEYRWVLGSR